MAKCFSRCILVGMTISSHSQRLSAVNAEVASQQTFEERVTVAQSLTIAERKTGTFTLDFTVSEATADKHKNDNYGEEFRGRLTLVHGQTSGGWIGLGFPPIAASSEPTMVGSRAVIGLKGQRIDLWYLGGYDISLVSSPEDVLLFSNFSQSETHSVLEFGVKARELDPAEWQIPQTLVWAVGSSNTLAHHAHSGTVSLAKASSTTSARHHTLWNIHGWLAFLSWGILAPTGIAASVLRGMLPSSFHWLTVHITLQVWTAIFSLVAVVVAISATSKSHSSHFGGNHQQLGLGLLLGTFLQIFIGLGRPRRRAGHGVDETPETSAKKAMWEIAWQVGHRVVALFLVAASIVQMTTGLDRFHDKFQRGRNDRQWGLWIYMGVFAALLLVLRLGYWLKRQRQIQEEIHSAKASDELTPTLSSKGTSATSPGTATSEKLEVGGDGDVKKEKSKMLSEESDLTPKDP